MVKATRKGSNMATSAEYKRHLDRVVTAHLGHFNASVSWAIEHSNDVGVGYLADLIADRDSSAVRHMTGMSGYVCDRDVWMRKLERAVLAMLADLPERVTV